MIAAAGDIACDPTNSSFNGGNGSGGACMQKATANLLASLNPAAVLLLGDNQYYCGGYQAFVRSYDLSWGQYKSITHPSVGNHEYLTSGGTDCNSANANASGYFKYFGAAAGQAGEGYYSFDVGSWHLIAINSSCPRITGGCAAGGAQYNWLQSDLKENGGKCTLAFWHIPLFSSGGRAAANTKSLWNLLYAAHADVVLNGHDHIYERFAPQNPNGGLDNANGIREFLAGTGGANHTSIASVAANSQVRNTSTFGVLELTLHSASWDWKFVPVAGGTFTDSGTQACHDATNAGAPAAPGLSLTTSGGAYAPAGTARVFYNPSANGSFTVSASVDSTTTRVQFPSVFASEANTQTKAPFSQTYTWPPASTMGGSFPVTASNGTVSSAPSSFTVTPDATAPSSSAACNNGPDCSSTYSGQVTVTLRASDSGAGVQAIYYSTDASPPATVYDKPFSVPAGTTITYYAVDNVGNQESTETTTPAIGAGGGSGIALVRQATGATASNSSLTVPLEATSIDGDALVAAVALNAGATAAVNSVHDSSGVTWTRGPVGYLSGSNTRVEIWYRLRASPVTTVTITASATKSIGANVSEWSGVGTAVDAQAGGSHASSTTATTPTITTSTPGDLVIGAINCPSATSATVVTTGFTSLNDVAAGSLVHEHAAYKLTTAGGSQQAGWTLNTSSTSGGAVLALTSA